jgi:hypothetical protein
MPDYDVQGKIKIRRSNSGGGGGGGVGCGCAVIIFGFLLILFGMSRGEPAGEGPVLWGLIFIGIVLAIAYFSAKNR